jgi:hypothetical protein
MIRIRIQSRIRIRTNILRIRIHEAQKIPSILRIRIKICINPFPLPHSTSYSLFTQSLYSTLYIISPLPIQISYFLYKRNFRQLFSYQPRTLLPPHVPVESLIFPLSHSLSPPSPPPSSRVSTPPPPPPSPLYNGAGWSLFYKIFLVW